MIEPPVVGMWLQSVLLVEDAADGVLLVSMMQLVSVSAVGKLPMSKAVLAVLAENATTGK